jgi:transposase-like protein
LAAPFVSPPLIFALIAKNVEERYVAAAVWGLGMDNAAFAIWRTDIVLLTATQRSVAFFELASAEANDPIDRFDEEDAETARPNEISGAPDAVAPSGASPRVAPAAESDLLSQMGRDRIANFGCPHCGGDSIGLWGRANGMPRYRCKECRKTFSPLTGTPLAGLHHKDRWMDQAQALTSGESIAKAAERCAIDPTTAFRWRHRFLSALNLDKPTSLSGIVEADETFILESFKGKREGLPRPSRERGGKAAKRGLSAEQIPVIVARDRTGATLDAVLPKLDAASLTAALGGVIAPSTDFCCDGGSAITAFARRAKLNVHVLPAPGNPRPEAPEHHINNVNGYHGRLKEWMRRFHGVATKNLASYLSWRRTTEALGAAMAAEDWIMAAAGMGPYRRKMQI